MSDLSVGDFVAHVVGMPGPDVDHGVCAAVDDGKFLVRYQVWQQPGAWHERWVASDRCWREDDLSRIGPALRAERGRLMDAS